MAAHMDQLSAIRRGQLKLFSFPQTHNQLQLGIRKEQIVKYFDFVQEDSFVLRLEKRSDMFISGSAPCSVCASVLSLDIDLPARSKVDACDSNGLESFSLHEENIVGGGVFSILCTPQFLSHYGFAENEILFTKVICPPPLSKVILEASTFRAFQWASSHCFTTGLLVNVCNQHRVLARQNELFLSPYSTLFGDDFDGTIFSELKVVDTEPFQQGILSIKTEFVVINGSQKEAKPSVEISDKVVGRKSGSLDHVDSSFAPAHVSDFAVPFTSVFVPRLVNKPTLNTKNLQNVILHRDWNVLPCRSLCGLIDASAGKVNPESLLDHTVFVSLYTAKQYSLFSGSLIEIQLEDAKPEISTSQECVQDIKQNPNTPKHREQENCNNKTTPNKSCSKVLRLVKVQVLPQEAVSRNEENQNDKDVLHVSTSLWYNLTKGDIQLSIEDAPIKFRKHQPQKEYLASCSASWQGCVPHAREVYIACVYSPMYSSGGGYGHSLQQYFNTPRLHQIGDIFAIDPRADLELCQDSVGGAKVQPLVFFKVKKISPKLNPKLQSYIVDTDHSTLYQDGSCHSYVPTSLEPLLHDARHQQGMPPGLHGYTAEISALVQPYLRRWNGSSENSPSILLKGLSGCGKTSLARAVAHRVHMHYFQVNCHELCGETSSATEARILQCVQRVCVYSPCILLLHNVHALGKDRDGTTEDSRVASYFHQCIQKIPHQHSPDWPVIVMASTSVPKQLTGDMLSGFLHTFQISVPDDSQRTDILETLMADVACSKTVSIRRVAQRTAGFVLGDLKMLIGQAKKVAYNRIKQTCFPGRQLWSVTEEEAVCLCGPLLQQADFDKALDQIQATHSDSIGAPKIPNVTWDDVGGLGQVKADILDTIQLPLQHPELFAAGLRRSGVLLFGPPGTGKTLLAKAVATECSLNFLSVKGPELINMYVGQSEENVREVFSRARNATPCVIFFDELDSLAPNRGRSGDSGGVMDRVVSQLLAELDGLHKACDVFVIGATNRPDLLDPALLRPGRFDKLLYLGVSEDKNSQLKILKALTRKFCLGPDTDLEGLVVRCPYNMTGADFYALCSDATLNALKRNIDNMEAGVCVDEEKVEVIGQDFDTALEHLIPSVSEMELQHYKTLKKTLVAQK